MTDADGIAYLAGRWDGVERRQSNNENLRRLVDLASKLVQDCRIRTALIEAGIVDEEDWDEEAYLECGPFLSRGFRS